MIKPDLTGWDDLPFWQEDWPRVAKRLAQDDRTILPTEPQRFAALSAVPPDAVRVVILGQDPYPTPGHANGLAFSVAPGVALPRSLRNIFSEMEADLGAAPATGDLSGWAAQGVLLLNTALSVPAGDAGGHDRIGWAPLIDQVLARAAQRPCAFLLWGAKAQKRAAPVLGPDHLVIATAHPSPLSARRGFFGSRPFSRINTWLESREESPIDWAAKTGESDDRDHSGQDQGL
ncbi:MAG: uracil-DNA glycosylase [Rhodobacterales bacterium]|nr:MAG: uracil-DNA glycosylase [Rhodobacterales bacterium]